MRQNPEESISTSGISVLNVHATTRPFGARKTCLIHSFKAGYWSVLHGMKCTKLGSPQSFRPGYNLSILVNLEKLLDEFKQNSEGEWATRPGRTQHILLQT